MDNDTTYLTIGRIKELTAIVKSVDPTYIEPFIEVGETMHIVPVLGLALDSELKTAIEQGTLSGNNETLVVNYIQPASAWYSFYESTPFLSIKAFNKGLVKQFSDNSTSIDREELRDYRQSILDKAVFYRNKLIDYLNNNKSLYPNYRTDNACGVPKSNSTGIFLG